MGCKVSYVAPVIWIELISSIPYRFADGDGPHDLFSGAYIVFVNPIEADVES